MHLNQETQTALLNEILNKEEERYADIKHIAYLPSTIYSPKLFIDGNQWCALYGNNRGIL